MANILIACEESQAICKAFRDRGHNAYSCDILECSGGHPEWHFKQDVLKVIPECGGTLENGETYFLPKGEMWDLMIAHPPCTYLSVSGARWLYHPEDSHLPMQKCSKIFPSTISFVTSPAISLRWKIHSRISCETKSPDRFSASPCWTRWMASKAWVKAS